MGLLERELGRILTAEQVADIIHKGVRHVRQHCEELGGKHIGDRYFYPTKRLDDALQPWKKIRCPDPDQTDQEERGDVLNTRQASAYLGVDPRFVIRYHEELGGRRVGSIYLYTERGIINALKPRKQLNRPEPDQRDQKREEILFKNG
ncbi:MAG: hypothetical protein HQK59_18320, partial [Deltaproteobacteria bacterium]|nr:hypothetical protein [Deltaproteobacteria bacterium]